MAINEAAAPLGDGGAGVRVAIFDTAVDEAHHDFCGEPNETAARFFRRDSDADVCSDFVDPIVGEIFGDPHGTHVAGVCPLSTWRTKRSRPHGI